MPESENEEQSFVFDEEVPANLDEIDGVPTGTFYDIHVASIKVYGDDASKAKRLNLRLKVLGPTHEGESIFASYSLPFPGEHNFARNRRLAFQQDTGLVGKDDQGQVKKIDYGRLINAEFTVEYESEVNKKDPAKPFKQVAFHGWHEIGWRPDGAAAAAGAPVSAPAAGHKVSEFDNI
jgi:hypothetical protein